MEAWLVPETRTLTETGGDPIELEQTTLFWEHFDYLVGNRFFNEAQLIDFGHQTVAEFALPFPLAIQDAVCHLYKSWHDGS